jgi:hypothetical protein
MKNDSQTYMIQTTMLSFNANDKQIISNNFVKMKLSSQYVDFAKVFNEKITNILFEHDFQNLAIDTQDINSSFESFYNLSEKELKTFKKYFDKHLQNEFIILSKSTCATFIFFIKKKTNCDERKNAESRNDQRKKNVDKHHRRQRIKIILFLSLCCVIDSD